jgi:hypothetical protein
MAKSISVITIVDNDGELTIDAIYDPETKSGQVCHVVMEGVTLAAKIADQESVEDDSDGAV